MGEPKTLNPKSKVELEYASPPSFNPAPVEEEGLAYSSLTLDLRRLGLGFKPPFNTGEPKSLNPKSKVELEYASPPSVNPAPVEEGGLAYSSLALDLRRLGLGFKPPFNMGPRDFAGI